MRICQLYTRSLLYRNVLECVVRLYRSTIKYLLTQTNINFTVIVTIINCLFIHHNITFFVADNRAWTLLKKVI